jgi:hypothetical protein
MLKGTQAMTTELRPTDDQIESACLSYRHDFGLLDVAEQSKVKYAGLEWLLAWQKAMPEMGNTQAAIAAAMMGAADIARHEADLIDKRDDLYGRPANSDEAVTARGIAGLILLAIPTDATAAREERERQVWNEALDEYLDRIKKLRGKGWEGAPAVHPYDKGYLAALDAMHNAIRAMKKGGE